MKKTISILAIIAAVCGVMSCDKKGTTPDTFSNEPTCFITVNIGMENTTKAGFVTENTTDKKINTLQIFVFDADGKLETDLWKTYGTPLSGTASETIATFSGTKTVYAVCNRSRLVLPKEFTLANFEGELTTQYGASTSCTILSDLSENSYAATTSNLVMSGKNTINVLEYNKNAGAPTTSTQEAQTVNIYVKRLAAMVKLEKVTVNFVGTSLEGATFTIKGMYLRNAVGKSRIGMSGISAAAAAAVYPLDLSNTITSTAANWYNRGKLSVGTGPAVTQESFTQAFSKVDGTATSVNHCLLTYPNRVDTDSNKATFDARLTRLVIHANIQKTGVIDSEAAGECWYTFDLPKGLKANNIYKIENITISLFGANTDDDSLNDDPGRITPTVTVDNWANGATLNYSL